MKILNFSIILLLILNLQVYFKYNSLEEVASITFLNVGQGDSILFKTKKGDIGLIDTGKNIDILNRIISETRGNNNSLKFMILTHPDLDHIGIADEIVKNTRVEYLFLNLYKEKYNELLSKIPEKTKTYSLFDENDFNFDEFFFNILWPSKNNNLNALDSNDTSISIKIIYQGFKILTLGDLGLKKEELIESDDIDILKVSHHGSKYSTSKKFLSRTTPEVAILSYGKNSYGHPSNEVINNLMDFRVTTLSTYQHGDIKILFSNGEYSIKTEY